MKYDSDDLWTIDQLRDAVANALGEGYDGPPNGRVRDVPDARTIRYYTTLGLIDRATEMRGRTAFYGPRHLLQLVAIKKLQAKGQSLAEVQRALTGQPDAVLARLAALDPGLRAAVANRAKSPRREFWKEPPAPAPASTISASDSLMSVSLEPTPEVNGPPQALQGIPLAENVTLLLASSRPLEIEDLEALRSVSRPLIDLLVKLEITPPREKRGTR